MTACLVALLACVALAGPAHAADARFPKPDRPVAPAVGYREVDHISLAPADGFLSVFVPPATLPAP